MKNRSEETSEDMTIGRAVAARLRDQSRSAAGQCLDIETLAAFYDHSLAGSERQACEGHVLTCLRCQEYLAELARLGDVDEPPVLPEEQISAAEQRAARGWTLRVAWAAPFLAVLIFIGIWFRQDIDEFLQRPEQTAMKESQPEVPPGQSAKSVKERKPEAQTPAAMGKASKAQPESAVALPAPSPMPPQQEARAGAPAMTVTGGPATDAGGEAINAPRARADLSLAKKPADRVLNYSASELKRASREGAAPPVPSSAQAESAPAETGRATAVASQLGGVTIRGNAPRFSPRWRVSRQGTIQKADESGEWVNVPSGVREDLFDITFAGDAAGWVVGHEGTVLRSTNGGAAWQKVSSPTSEDLVRVSAESDRQAQVISRSGKIFSTNDGGKTWRLPSP